MMIEMQFNSIAQLQRLQEIASSCDDEIFLHYLDDSVRVDAKSFIGLFTLDFTQPVKVVTDSDYWPARWSISSIRWRNKTGVGRWPTPVFWHSKIGHVPLTAGRPICETSCA